MLIPCNGAQVIFIRQRSFNNACFRYFRLLSAWGPVSYMSAWLDFIIKRNLFRIRMALTEESFVLYTNHDSGVVVAIPSSFQGITLPLWEDGLARVGWKRPEQQRVLSCAGVAARRPPASFAIPPCRVSLGLLFSRLFRRLTGCRRTPFVGWATACEPAGADSLRLAVVRPSVCARRWRARAAGRAAGRQGGSSARVRRSRRRSGGGARHRGRDSCHSGCHSSLPRCGRGGWS